MEDNKWYWEHSDIKLMTDEKEMKKIEKQAKKANKKLSKQLLSFNTDLFSKSLNISSIECSNNGVCILVK